jgi:hypothetical protein
MSKLSTAALVLLSALAVASGAACQRAEATRADVPDRVTITAPQDQAMFTAGDDITVEVAIETREPVQRVDLHSIAQ